MKCPHCVTEFHAQEQETILGQDADGGWAISRYLCPACDRLILYLVRCSLIQAGSGPFISDGYFSRTLFRPKGASRPPPPPDLPTQFLEDYQEACLVLPDSPKASAALSRRCLQHILRDVANVKHSNLSNEIQEVLDSGKLPSLIAESIDAIRNIGNFASHPIKSQSTGEIVPVEPGEAEWNLDVLEALFDFYFVQPSLLKRKRDALNAKLIAAGKPAMK